MHNLVPYDSQSPGIKRPRGGNPRFTGLYWTDSHFRLGFTKLVNITGKRLIISLIFVTHHAFTIMKYPENL